RRARRGTAADRNPPQITPEVSRFAWGETAPMRIAQIAPLTESVPPQLYGGTERVVAYLTDELVSLGHDVTLFASGDSRTAAKLAPAWPTALRLGPECRDHLAPHLVMLEQVAATAAEFDVLHFHLSGLHPPLVRRLDVPHVTT